MMWFCAIDYIVLMQLDENAGKRQGVFAELKKKTLSNLFDLSCLTPNNVDELT